MRAGRRDYNAKLESPERPRRHPERALRLHSITKPEPTAGPDSWIEFLELTMIRHGVLARAACRRDDTDSSRSPGGADNEPPEPPGSCCAMNCRLAVVRPARLGSARLVVETVRVSRDLADTTPRTVKLGPGREWRRPACSGV